MALRGDPDFDATSLPADQQTRLSSMKSLITGTHKSSSRDPFVMAARDDTWWYASDLRTNLMAQMLALRVTGDLWFVDTICELGEIMYGELDYPYRGTHADGATEGENDGYLKWVQRANATVAQQGTDLRVDYDVNAHTTFAMMTYVLHNNRDLTSPKAYAYGTIADKWRDYMIDHFEAKLRTRNIKPTGFPILSLAGGLEMPLQNDRYHGWMAWHYWMGEITGDTAYTDEAARMTAYWFANTCTPSTSEGDALVFQRNATGSDFGQDLSWTTYTEFVTQVMVDLHLEGFGAWADPVHLERFGRSFSQFLCDTATPFDDGLARDIGGGVSRCGWSASSTSRLRVSKFVYQNGLYGLVAPWDPTGKAATLNEQHRVWAVAQNEDYTRIVGIQMLTDRMANP